MQKKHMILETFDSQHLHEIEVEAVNHNGGARAKTPNPRRLKDFDMVFSHAEIERRG
jgi:hypothetical protein